MTDMCRGLFFSLLIVIAAGCKPLNRISNRDMASLYDPVMNSMRPDFVAYNVTDTTTRLYFRISTSEILYQQREGGALISNVRLSCRIFESYDTDRFSDSCSAVIEDIRTGDEEHLLVHYVDFRTPAAREYILELQLTDVNRHASQKSYLPVNNRTMQAPVNFLLVNSSDSVPFFKPYLSSADNFSIISRPGVRKELFVRYFNRNYPLAVPAYKYTDLAKFNYRSDATYRVNLESSNEFNFKERGIYHLQTDSTVMQGLTIYRFSDDYPRITQAAELAEPLRYLTTSREFNKIMNSQDKKAAIDDFWLDIAGNKTKGRELIRIFYTRVEEANRYFTSYHEGWKTDRGLIYIIFGEPDVVYRGEKHEDWNYSSSFDHGPINFTFEKVNNPFSPEDYNLRRSPSYEGVWFLAVDEWRQGRQMEIE